MPLFNMNQRSALKYTGQGPELGQLGIDKPTAFGLQRIEGEGTIGGICTLHETRLSLNGECDSPMTVFELRGPRWNSGLIVLDMGTEQHNYGNNGGPAYEHGLRFLSGETIVLDHVVKRDTDGQLKSILSGGDPADWRTISKRRLVDPRWEILVLHSILLLNLETGRATCLEGISHIVRLDKYGFTDERSDHALLNKSFVTWWGDLNEDPQDGSIPLRHFTVDRLQVRVEGWPADSGHSTRTQPEWMMVGADPIFILGDYSAWVLADFARTLRDAPGIVCLPGPPTILSAGTILDEGRTLCGLAHEERAASPPLADPTGPMTALLGIGARLFVLSIATVGIGREGWPVECVTLIHDGDPSDDTCEVWCTDTALVIRIGPSGEEATYTFEYSTEKYMSIDGMLGAIDSEIANVTCDVGDGPLLTPFLNTMNPSSRFVRIAEGEPIDFLGGSTTLMYRDPRPLDTMAHQMESIVRAIRAAGGDVAICGPLPRGSAVFASQARTDSAERDALEWRDRLIALCTRYEVPHLDLYTILGDGTGKFAQEDYTVYGILLQDEVATYNAVIEPLTEMLNALPMVAPRPMHTAHGRRTGFDEAQHIQPYTEQVGDTAGRYLTAPAQNVTLGAIQMSIQPGNRVGSPVLLDMFQHAEKVFPLTVRDVNGDPVDLSEKTLRFVVFDSNSSPNPAFKVEGDDITVTGDENEVANVKITAAKSATASTEYRWVLWDVTADGELLNGALKIFPAVKDVA